VSTHSRPAHRGGELPWRVRASLLPRRWSWSVMLAFGVTFVGTLAVAMLQGEKPFFNDSGGYWQLGTTFTANGHFSLLNYDDPSRGYVWPLIIHGLQALQGDLAWTSSSMAKLLNVLIFALIGAVLGPALIRTVWPEQPSWGISRRLALSALVVVFWSGFLNFPLTDFPALAMVVLSVVAVARTDRLGWMLVAGAATAMAIDMRPEYEPLLPIVLALVAWRWFEQRGARHASVVHRTLCASMLVIGFGIVSLPESLSAHHYYRTWSFVPGAAVVEPAGTYLSTGMPRQAYNTRVVDGQASVAMEYRYPAGQRLLEKQKEGKITGTSQYIGLFASHPIVMGGLLLRHIINGLDPLYSTPYVENLDNGGQIWARIAAFLLLFIALLRVLWPAARHKLGPGRLRYLLALTLSCVTAVPSGMETRYLLPIYLLSYAVALTPGWPNPIGPVEAGLRRFETPAVIAVAFAAFTAVVWYITNDAISHLAFVS
jgi:hypothetical protein